MSLLDQYTPTDAERKILETLANPDNRDLSIKEICDKAGTSRKTYERAMKKPGFRKLMQDICFELIKNEAGDMIKAAIKHAKEGNFNYFKTLMEMGGLYTPKEKREITGETTVNSNIKLDNLSYEQLKELLKE